MSEQIKIAYERTNGFQSVAYVDEDSGIGMDKYDEGDVTVRFDEPSQQWMEVVNG